MNKRYIGMLVTLCLSAVAAWGQPQPTEPNVKGPIDFLSAHDARVRSLLQKAPSDTLSRALKDTIKAKINAAFDFEELSRLALGTHWEQRTPDERAHFVRTFSGIIREQNFDSFVRYYRESTIRYDSQQVDGDKAVVMASVPLERETVAIAYDLHRRDDRWLVCDLSIDGASTAEGNRRRYARYLEKKSYDMLIQQLDKQLARLQEDGK